MARKHTAGAVSPEGAGMRRPLALALASCLTVPLLRVHAAESPKRYTETLTTKRGQKLSFDMALIPAGKFLMGSPANELGNVSEWVLDFYSPTAYAENARHKPAVAPQGPAKGKVHVARGGHYDSPPADLRCAARAFEEPWWTWGDPKQPKSKWFLVGGDFVGFRVAREIEEKR